MGSPGRTPSSRFSSLPIVRMGLRPVSLASTRSAFSSFSPPSPTPMLTVTLAMRAASIGLRSEATSAFGAWPRFFTTLMGAGAAAFLPLPCGAAAADVLACWASFSALASLPQPLASLPSGLPPLASLPLGSFPCLASSLDNRLHLGLGGQVGLVPDGERVGLDGGERRLGAREVHEVRLVALGLLDGLHGGDLARVAAVGDEDQGAGVEGEVAQDLLAGDLEAQDAAGGVVVLLDEQVAPVVQVELGAAAGDGGLAGDLDELPGGLLVVDGQQAEAGLLVDEDAEGLLGLRDRDDVHEADGELGVGDLAAVHQDVAGADDARGLAAGGGELEVVAHDGAQRQGALDGVRAGAGLGGVDVGLARDDPAAGHRHA